MAAIRMVRLGFLQCVGGRLFHIRVSSSHTVQAVLGAQERGGHWGGS